MVSGPAMREIRGIHRLRGVREFRGRTRPRAEFQEDFEAAVEAVDRVWKNPELRRFWRLGARVPNRAHPHPYHKASPSAGRGPTGGSRPTPAP